MGGVREEVVGGARGARAKPARPRAPHGVPAGGGRFLVRSELHSAWELLVRNPRLSCLTCLGRRPHGCPPLPAWGTRGGQGL